MYNRGNTHKGIDNYPNQALKMHNEAKIIGAINKKFKSEEHKKAFMEMTESAFQKAYEQSIKGKEKEHNEVAKKSFSDTNHGIGPQINSKYGGMLNAKGMQNVDNKIHSRLRKQKDLKDDTKFQEEYKDVQQLDGTYKRKLVQSDIPDFSNRSNSSSYFVGRAVYDDFTSSYDVGRENVGAEFSHYELDNYGKPEERTEFKNKIEEDIYRAKKHLLKTKGTY